MRGNLQAKLVGIVDRDFDVAVIGCGIVGKCAALVSLALGRSVSLIGSEASSPAGPDYALGAAALSFLASVGIRPDDSTPVRRMRIFPAAGTGVLFSAAEAGLDELCRIVPHASLDNALSHRLQKHSGLARFASPIKTLDNGSQVCRIGLANGGKLSASIVVGADGMESSTARIAGMTDRPVGYGQCALTARFRPARPAPCTAWQWFDVDDVLAMLPVGDCMSMVWSMPTATARSVMELDAQDLARLAESRIQGMLGKLDPVSPTASRELFRLTRWRLATGRVALAGDSAHGVHPLAGMGLNLGLADCAALRDLCLHRPAREACALLRRYSNSRALGKLAPETAVALLAHRVAKPSRAGIALESLVFGCAKAWARCKSAAASAANC